MHWIRRASILAVLALLAGPVAAPLLAQEADYDWWDGEYDYEYQTQDADWSQWRSEDEGNWDYNFGNAGDYGYDDRYEDNYDADDDFGFYDSGYDWQTEEGWFEDWYGDANSDWDWF